MATKKSNIKLLFFSPYFYPYISGLTQYPFRLFTESNLPLDVTCLTFKHIKNLESISVISNNDTTILRMPFLFRISKGFISPQSLIYFWNETKKHDVVMINLPSFEGIFLSLFAFIQQKPLISLLHCEVLLPFSIPNIIINFVLNCGVFFQLLFSKKIIVYTEDYYEKKWMYLFFKHKMEVILPPVHVLPSDEMYMRNLQKLKRAKYTIGFCGRIAAEKGIEILLESVSSLKNIMVFFAGPTGKDVIGEETYYIKIQKLLNMKKIPHIFFGTLSAGRLSSFYNVIDVLVLPSLNKTEAFGMVQVEAMLQGTPVIASNLPGVRVPIQLTKMGILTTPYNSLEIKNAILEVISHKKKYSNKKLVENVKKIFNPEKTYKEIYNVISNE